MIETSEVVAGARILRHGGSLAFDSLKPRMATAAAVGFTFFLVCVPAGHAAVLCAHQDSETGNFVGAIEGREHECDQDQVEVGEVLDANQGTFELLGNEVDFRPGSYNPDPALPDEEAQQDPE